MNLIYKSNLFIIVLALMLVAPLAKAEELYKVDKGFIQSVEEPWFKIEVLRQVSPKEALFSYCQSDHCGLVDSTGTLVVPPIPGAIRQHGPSYFIFEVNGLQGLARRSGEWLLPPAFRSVSALSAPGLISVVDKNGKQGLVRIDGKVLLPIKYDYISGHELPQGLHEVNDRSGTTRLFSAQRGWIGPSSIEEATGVGADLVAVKIGGKWGLLESDGSWVLQPSFEKLEKAHSGTLNALKNGVWGVVGMDGNWIARPQFKEIFARFRNGNLLVHIGDEFGVVDSFGRWVDKNIDANDTRYTSNPFALLDFDFKWRAGRSAQFPGKSKNQIIVFNQDGSFSKVKKPQNEWYSERIDENLNFFKDKSSNLIGIESSSGEIVLDPEYIFINKTQIPDLFVGARLDDVLKIEEKKYAICRLVSHNKKVPDISVEIEFEDNSLYGYNFSPCIAEIVNLSEKLIIFNNRFVNDSLKEVDLKIENR